MSDYNQDFCQAIWKATVDTVGNKSQGHVPQLFDALEPFSAKINTIENEIKTAIQRGDIDKTKDGCSEWQKAHFWALSSTLGYLPMEEERVTPNNSRSEPREFVFRGSENWKVSGTKNKFLKRGDK